MSVVWVHERNDSEEIDQDVTPGSQSITIVRRFDVLTNSMSDGTSTVCTADDGTVAIPQPFTVYDKGDTYNENLVAVRCRGRRNKPQPLLWQVDVEYSQAVGFDITGGGQGGSSDITCFLPSARCWKVPIEKIIWKARSQLPAIAIISSTAETFAQAMAKSKSPIVNSCNKLFSDGITGLEHARAWEIRRYQWFFDEGMAKTYQDRVNADSFWGYDPGTVKMVSISGEWQSVSNSLVWLVSYEFHYHPDGWGEQLIDNGMERWCKADGSVPPSLSDVAGQCAIKDEVGQPIAAPVLLDGAGYDGVHISAPLAHDGTPVIVTWHHLEQATFADIWPPLPTRESMAIIDTTES